MSQAADGPVPRRADSGRHPARPSALAHVGWHRPPLPRPADPRVPRSRPAVGTGRACLMRSGARRPGSRTRGPAAGLNVRRRPACGRLVPRLATRTCSRPVVMDGHGLAGEAPLARG